MLDWESRKFQIHQIDTTVSKRQSKWILVCKECQNERTASYCQAWNILTNKFPNICFNCREYNPKSINMNEKEQLNTELEKYLKDNPDLQEVMKLFGETMSTYNEILAAMGQQQAYQITAGNTAQGTLHLCTSATTSSFKITGK